MTLLMESINFFSQELLDRLEFLASLVNKVLRVTRDCKDPRAIRDRQVSQGLLASVEQLEPQAGLDHRELQE